MKKQEGEARRNLLTFRQRYDAVQLMQGRLEEWLKTEMPSFSMAAERVGSELGFLIHGHQLEELCEATGITWPRRQINPNRATRYAHLLRLITELQDQAIKTAKVADQAAADVAKLTAVVRGMAAELGYKLPGTVEITAARHTAVAGNDRPK